MGNIFVAARMKHTGINFSNSYITSCPHKTANIQFQTAQMRFNNSYFNNMEKMGNKAVNYFVQSADRAKTHYTEYYNRTEGQARNLSFVSGGCLKKSCRKRLNTITDKQVKLYSAFMLRRLFLRICLFEPYAPDCRRGLDEILGECQRNIPVQRCDEYDYWRYSFDDCSLDEKYKAIRHFIDSYGTATDKKYLLPKFPI